MPATRDLVLVANRTGLERASLLVGLGIRDLILHSRMQWPIEIEITHGCKAKCRKVSGGLGHREGARGGKGEEL